MTNQNKNKPQRNVRQEKASARARERDDLRPIAASLTFWAQKGAGWSLSSSHELHAPMTLTRKRHGTGLKVCKQTL